MRKPIVAGNWKMNNTMEKSIRLVNDLIPLIKNQNKVDRVIIPPFTALATVSDLLRFTSISCGAQNLFWEPKGAYTGEISAYMIEDLADYVIIGHSERRTYFNETDETVNKKIVAALNVGLTPIMCVGETYEENQAGKTGEVILHQMNKGLADIPIVNGTKFVVAYEPVWAIGTGLAATGEVANNVIADYIREPLSHLFGEEVAQRIRVLYGGSVNAANAAEFFEQPEIDGALVGGASLKSHDFADIVNAAASAKK